jgi:hypothetical protein
MSIVPILREMETRTSLSAFPPDILPLLYLLALILLVADQSSLIFKEEKFPSAMKSHLRDSGPLEKDGHGDCWERRDQNRLRCGESQ